LEGGREITVEKIMRPEAMAGQPFWGVPMLSIRSDQIKVFQEAAIGAFEVRMLKHLQDSFPWQYRMWGRETALILIRYGFRRAQQYGLSSERDHCLYLTLMSILGSYFDSDPQLPWAGEILADAAIREPVIRINRLVDRAMHFLKKVQGENQVYLKQSLAVTQRDLPGLITASSAQGFQSQALALLKRLSPQKYAEVGEVPLRRSIATGIDRADQYGITTQPGHLLFVAIMFTLGSGFHEDPQFSDLAALLAEPAAGKAEDRVERLSQAFMTYLGQWSIEIRNEPRHA
jgi:hypothetical protein